MCATVSEHLEYDKASAYYEINKGICRKMYDLSTYILTKDEMIGHLFVISFGIEKAKSCRLYSDNDGMNNPILFSRLEREPYSER